MTTPSNQPPAQKHPECSCYACVSACKITPGWFAPEQLKTSSAALGMTEQEFFNNYCMVDYWVGHMSEDPANNNNRVYIIAAALTGYAGKLAPLHKIGICSCLRAADSKCSIHACKPTECAESIHTDSIEVASARHDRIKDAWNNPDAQDLIRALVAPALLPLLSLPDIEFIQHIRASDRILERLMEIL